MLRTEQEFHLPMGFLDSDGTLHRDGVMRLATAADEIEPLRDPRVRSNDAYLAVILMSRVITRLGSLERITPKIVECLFAADLQYLQKLYNELNCLNDGRESTSCPQCGCSFELNEPETVGVGGSSATPSPSSTRR